MDAQRFENLARTLASRLSRRNALRRAGVAASASLLAATGMRPDKAAALIQAQNDGQPLFTLIRRYTLNVPTGQVRRALQQGYVEDACKAPGFVAYLTVEDEDGDFVTVAVFRSQNDLANFANAEATWIAQNLDDLLPAPDEAISGDTYVHAAAPQGFPNTCSAASAQTAPPSPPSPPATTGAPAQPTNAPAQPTAVSSGPTPTPVPACTGQGCTCSTGAQSPCDAGLVCCPTTDLMGGPGVCQTEAVCYPNECRADGRSCPRSCGTTEACPSCCSNYCNGDGVCDEVPTACTSAGCTCTTGTQNSCDAGLICCGTSGVPGGPGTCSAQTDCGTPCTGANCICDPNTANSCDQGLICCGVTDGYICVNATQCGSAPCSGDGCECDFHDPNSCDQGLVCCAVQSGFICTTSAQCGGSCTGEGCACTGGVQGACDDGLTCCVQSDPGAPGTCQTMDGCPGSLCTGEGCPCNGGVQGACQDGLICCQDDPSIVGGAGTCQPTDACGGAPPCSNNGTDCSVSCTDGVNCFMCCTGYCNAAGLCDDVPQTTCISDGVNCGGTCNWSDSCDACCSGFCDGAGNCNEPGASAGACGDEGCGCELANPVCDDGLVCCDDGSGVTGTCTTGC